MAIQDSDLLLINRAGASYKVAASDLADKVQAGDLALVNRSGDSYKLTGDNLTAGTFNDTDLFLINRAGASYQVLGSEIKTLVVSQPVPPISDATWTFDSKNTNGSNFKLTITFGDGAVFIPDSSTEVLLALGCSNNSYVPASAELRAPATNVGGTTYEAAVWDDIIRLVNVTIAPSFTSLNGGNKLSFVLFIPNSVTIAGSSYTAKTSPINGAWKNGRVVVKQGNNTSLLFISTFNANDGYFN